jgi:hypothetical protein
VGHPVRTSLSLLVLLAACGDPSLKGEGEECFGTAECREGLTCNLGEQPSRCRSMQTPLPDAAASIDADLDLPDADPTAPDAAAPPDAPSGIPDAQVPDAEVPDADRSDPA